MPRYGMLTPEQHTIYKEIDHRAFVASREDTEWWWAHFKIEEARGLFDDENNILVGMRIIENGALYFRSETPIPTALITSVGSAPENRRKGYIRDMFAGMFAEMRAGGMTLTALYPFYFPFYRAFGYELAADIAMHTVHLDQFKPWRHAGDAGKFVSSTEKDWEAFNAIYVQNARQTLGAIDRDQLWWKFEMTHDRQPTPAYIYYNAAGQPAGYVIYHFKDKGNWEREMVVHDMAAIDRAAHEALFGFLYNHDSQAEKVKLNLPVDYPLSTQLPDPRKDEVKIAAGYMLRLLDVAGALRARSFVPESQGAFTMSVTDAMLPENSGIYHVQVRDGRAEVEVTQGDGAANKAGLHLDSLALAQLYSGYLSPTKAAAIGKLTVRNEADLRAAQAVFSPAGQPAPFMANEF